MRVLQKRRIHIPALLLCSLFIVVFMAPQAAALSGSQFNAANIIDNSVFFNANTMNAGDVQNFLNSKVPTCDTNGTQPSGHGGLTRAQWGAQNGNPAPYTCLRHYTQSVPSKGPDAYCSGGINGATKTAAQIIFDVAQACSINPKALIVLLQKEQSLITDDWPWPIQYRSATGYGCPDTAPCDTEYYGFFNQVYNAARQMQRYVKQPQNFNFAAGRTSNIQYNPNAGCGSSPVGIQNGSTAALYNYTPYQPNAAALANLYGTGDGCSAYGNRNFWRMFNDWFGSTQTNVPYAWRLTSFEIYSNSARTQPFSGDTTVAPGGKVYIRVKAQNVGNETWDRSFLKIGTFRPMQRSSDFYDSSTWLDPYRPAQLIENAVPPGQTGTLEFVMKAPSTPGTYREYLNLVAENRMWLNDLSVSVIINVVAPTTPNNSNRSTLQSGEVLRPKEYLLSPDGQSTLSLQDDGNLVLYSNYRALWNTVTFGKPADRLEMGGDGNLVLYFKDGSTWSTGTQGNPGSSLRLQTDGNLVLYNASSNPTWNTVTFQNPDNLSYVNNILRPGTLRKGQQLETADRRYRLLFQQDGNLVLYSSANRALWSSNTHSTDAMYTTLQDDGNFVIYDSGGRPLWNTITFGNPGARLIIQQDGNLVLYNSSDQAAWNTRTFNQY